MAPELFSLKGKSAIVTGGSRGIGAEICRALAAAGADVAVVGRKVEGCEQLVAEIACKGVKAVAIGAHVAKPQDCDRIINDTMCAFGKIDILINNAATNVAFGPALDCSEEALQKIMDVNLKGPFMLIKRVAPIMEKSGGGAIVNMASTAGLVPPYMIGMYGVSKAALIHMSKVFAKELGIFGIRVNVVAPGLVKTEFSKAIWSNDEILKEYLDSQPIKRLTNPGDIVGAVLFLASSSSSMVTGEVVIVDGGQMLG